MSRKAAAATLICASIVLTLSNSAIAAQDEAGAAEQSQARDQCRSALDPIRTRILEYASQPPESSGVSGAAILSPTLRFVAGEPELSNTDFIGETAVRLLAAQATPDPLDGLRMGAWEASMFPGVVLDLKAPGSLSAILMWASRVPAINESIHFGRKPEHAEDCVALKDLRYVVVTHVTKFEKPAPIDEKSFTPGLCVIEARVLDLATARIVASVRVSGQADKSIQYNKRFGQFRAFERLSDSVFENAQARLFESLGAATAGLVATKRKAIKDAKQSVATILKAEAGDANAQWELGGAYYLGEGVEKNLENAFVWARKAAEQGLATAQTSLGAFYQNGEGVTRNDAEAVAWFRKAAEQGDAGGQAGLGEMFAEGRGVSKDLVEARRRLRLAIEGGDEQAEEYLAKLEQANP